jgi:hypothetical protein
MEATKGQLRIFHAILAKRGIADMKSQLVSSQSDGRTEHASELTVTELSNLIKRLQLEPEIRFDSAKEAENRMRRRILSLCYSIGWTILNREKSKQEVDWAKLNAWLVKYGYLHKLLNEYNYHELTKLVTQFENFTKTEML